MKKNQWSRPFDLSVFGMPCTTTRNNSWRLVIDAELGSNYALVGKLNSALSLDSGNNCINILRNIITLVYQATRHVLASKLVCEVATELLRRKLLLSEPFPYCLLCKTSLTEFWSARGFSGNTTSPQGCSNFNLQMNQPDETSQTGHGQTRLQEVSNCWDSFGPIPSTLILKHHKNITMHILFSCPFITVIAPVLLSKLIHAFSPFACFLWSAVMVQEYQH